MMQNDLLTAEQKTRLRAGRDWWQEGELALDHLAERAAREARLAALAERFEDLRTARRPSARHIARILPDLRELAPNPTLNRTLETDAFAAAVRELLFGDAPIAQRLDAFLLDPRRVGTQTATQFLFAAYPDRFPLVTSATRSALGVTRPQRVAARRLAVDRFDGAERSAPTTRALLGEFVLFDAARDALGLNHFADVVAIFRLLGQIPADAAPADAVVREAVNEYAAPEATERDLLALIEGRIAAQGFTFPELAVRDYYVSLKTKPFVILAGLSGTGKTRLTRLFADALTGDSAAALQYRLLPVGASWTDATPLIGFFNVLTNEYVSTPFLDLIVLAGRPENRDRAYFVCLDEMNLARVEHYFADVLSAMETADRVIPLHSGRSARIPANVFLTGSVNIDEATHPFSKKVLDRANTIEFNEVHLRGEDGAAGREARRRALPEIDPAERQRLFLGARVGDVRMAHARLAALDPAFPDRVLATLESLNAVLTTRGMHFGYRVRDEALMYAANAFDASGNGLLIESSAEENRAVALDLQIVQKALPRVAGTQESLERLLIDLEAWAEENAFPRTRAKVVRMRRRAVEMGTVTFYEP